MTHRIRRFLAAWLMLSAVAGLATAQDLPRLPTKALHLPARGGRGGRDGLASDPVAAAVVSGKWVAPKAGDSITAAEGAPPQKWVEVEVGPNGLFPVRGGYLFLNVEASQAQVVRLDLSGHGSAMINGELRPGDPYGNGYLHLPIALKSGNNDLLIQSAGRGELKMGLSAIKTVAQIDTSDATTPDLIVGETEPLWLGVVVLNATESTLDNLKIEATANGQTAEAAVPSLAPLTRRKVPVLVKTPAALKAGTLEVKLALKQGKELDGASISLRVVEPSTTHKRTFFSKIDGSIQYYAVNPAHPVTKPREGQRPALFLSLHGASVEGLGQAQAYGPKSWGHIVAPTNRRPFGFDWEDWGRLDAIEVLELAQERLQTDPLRTYLTGHSMGGHGTWIVGATYPDRFAAIAPSAGWISMSSYAGARTPDNLTPMLSLMSRASAPSDTLSLAGNYASLGIYVLHGDADDNVPVTQARRMKEVLEKSHEDFHYFEQPKAGHWWSTPENEGTGAACVDWPPIFDLFAHRVIPRNDQVLSVDFTTANPGVSARSRWLTISSQIKALQPSHVQVSYLPGRHAFVGTTTNVLRFSLDVSWIDPADKLTFEIDKQSIKDQPRPADGTVWLVRKDDKWSVTTAPSPALKGPHRSGTFKDAFRHQMIFVYGTTGTPEENAWSLAKARFDAENFGYRGNGSVDVVSDKAFDPTIAVDRNVIVYGHAESNRAWKVLLGDSPVQVTRGRVSIGKRTETGDDLAVLFLRPRPGSNLASVGAVSGTGPSGLRRTDRLPYFVSGVAYPDVTVLQAIPSPGPDRGIRAVGFFGEDWGVERGEFRFGPDLPKP